MTLDTDYFLTSKRLGFRTWSNDDLDLAFGLWGDFEVTKLFDGRGPHSRDQVKHRLSQEITTQSKHGVQYWPVFLLESGDHVGCAGLRPYDASRNILEIGFHIRPNHTGEKAMHRRLRTLLWTTPWYPLELQDYLPGTIPIMWSRGTSL